MKVGSLMDLFKEADRPGKKVPKIVFDLLLSAILPVIILIVRPLEMTLQQCAVTSILILVIIWWCTGIVNKTVSSIILIISFLLFSGAPVKTVFSFPLSNTFLLIVLTYLFSRGVLNSGLADKYLEPLLCKVGNSAVKTLFLSAGMLVILIYAIPQPLARLIIIADILKGYLDKTDAPDGTKSVLLYGVFYLYIFVNMFTMSADIILNTTSVAVAGLEMSDIQWMKYMLIPSIAYTAFALLLFCLVLRKDICGKRLRLQKREPYNSTAENSSKKPTAILALVIVTMILWLTESLHGIPNWAITLGSVIIMLFMGELRPKDINAIDFNMLIFLTAAMSIGGVMSANGAADRIFSTLNSLIVSSSGNYAIFAVSVITICMHMILGSNTTTVSVVIPGVMYMCNGLLNPEVMLFTVHVVSVSQWLFPFHSVGLMMGTSKNYFTPKHVLMMGIPLTLFVFAAIFGLYLPWWRFLGIL